MIRNRPFVRAGLTFATIWILVTIVSYLLPACTTTPTGIEKRIDRLEYLADSTIYILEGELCDVNFRLCLIEDKEPNWTCRKHQELCEIEANKRFKTARKRH